MESAYSVTRLSNAYMGPLHHSHAHPYTQTHTLQSMITHQGFRVESWALTYRYYICRSLGFGVQTVHPFSPGPDCCMQPSDHMYNGVQIQTLLLPAVASLDKE